MADFNNARLDYQNFSFGPDSGRIYSIDHVNSVMLVKNDPGGVLDVPVSLIKTIPISSTIYSEVQTLEYDGYYFYSQNGLGTDGSSGTRIEKWELGENGNTLVKVPGAGNEFTLVNTAVNKYESEAMTIEVLLEELDDTAISGSSLITISDSSLVELGDAIYVGPNTSNDREVRRVVGILGQDLTLDSPLEHAYAISDEVRIRKSLFVFNNYNGLVDNVGQKLEYSTYTGNLISTGSSAEWKGVTAATNYDGNFYYTKGSQLLRYQPHGIENGYKSSLLLENIKKDNSTIIKIFDLAVNSSEIHKLQTSVHLFNSASKEFDDIDSEDEKYNIEREFFAAKVKTLTSHREDNSVLFGQSIESGLTIEMRDQYFIPIFGRSVSVTEDDVSGFIEPGYESFVTDVQGKGATIYNSGVSPLFANPIVTSSDLLTGLNLKTQLTQLSDISNLSFIEQFESREVSTFIDQRILVSTMPLQQSKEVSVDSYIDQVREQEATVTVMQHQILPYTFINQIAEVSNEIPIEQYPFIEATTAIEQYIFLIFAVPAPYSGKNDPYTDILVRIVGFGSLELDINTLVFKVNGIDVASQVESEAFPGGLQLTYDKSGRFEYGERVSVEIEIQDDGVPPNTISTVYYFDIVRDFIKPNLSQIFPPDESVDNSEDTEIYAIIEDLETGIDSDSIEMYVEGKLVQPTVTQVSDTSVKVSYLTTCNYPYKSKITASVLAADNSGNKFVGAWSFYIQNSPGVLYISPVPENCQVLVPVETTMCSEVFGLEEGVLINSLTLDLNGKPVRYVIKPKVFRKE